MNEKEIIEKIKILEIELKTNGFIDMNRLSILTDLYGDLNDSDKYDEIYKGWEAAKTITRINVIKKNIRNEYDTEIKKLDDDIFKIMKSCPHPYVNYYPDLSGNNGSLRECLCCGCTL